MGMIERDTVLTLVISENIDVKPDRAILVIHVANNEETSYFSDSKRCLDVGTNNVSKVIKLIKEFNIGNEDVKTANLDVKAKYEYSTIQKKNGLGLTNKETETISKRKISGYNYSCIIQVELNTDDKRLTKLYCELVNQDYIENVHIEFYAKNIENYYDKLVEKIVTKANHRAAVLAKAAYKAVESIISMDVGVNHTYVNFNSFVNTDSFDGCCFEDSVATHIESMANSEKVLSETITFKFRLK